MLIIAATLALPIASITNAVGNASAATTDSKILRIGFMQKIDSLNPYVGVSDAAYVFYGLVYDTLDTIDQDMNPVPSVAKDLPWTVPTDDPFMVANALPYGSVWQYNLSSYVTFHDGQPVTADDVVWNINLNAKNYTDLWAFQPYAYFMNYAYKVNDTVVRIVFYDRASEEPMPASYAYLLSIYILPRHMMRSMSSTDIGYKWTGVFDGEYPIVGTGPFMAQARIYDDWLAGNPITLVKNPNYFWEPQYHRNISFDAVQLKFYDDTLAMQYALQNGEIDIAQFPPQTYYNMKVSVDDGSLKNIETYDGPKVTQYWTEIGICDKANGKNPSRLDPIIKHAMAMATNKNYVINNFYLGFADVGTTIIPPINSYWHYEPTAAEKFPFDIEAAKALLEANDYTDINSDGIRECGPNSPAVKNNWVAAGTPLTYEMLVRAEYPEEKEIAKWLQTQWNQIGINFQYVVVDEPTLNTIVYSYEYDLMIWYWSADIDPNYQLFEATSMAIMGWNDIYYQSKAYDDNYTMSVKSMDRETRRTYVQNAQRVLYEDANYIILAYVYQTYAWRTDVWEGWGDWGAHPGRSVDNFWSGNPLWFDLKVKVIPPVIDDGGGGVPILYIAIGAGAAGAVVAAVVVLTLRGKKGGKAEKADSSPLGD